MTLSAIGVCQCCRQRTRPRCGDRQQIKSRCLITSLRSVGLAASSTATGGQSTSWSSGQDSSPGVYILSAQLLQCAALRYDGQLVSTSAVDPECSGATSDGHQATRPHLTSSITLALVASEATGHQTGYFGLQSRRVVKPLRTSRMIASSSLTLYTVVCARPMPTLSLFRKLTLGSQTGVSRWRERKYGTVSPPQCENRICAVQTTCRGISVRRDCGAL